MKILVTGASGMLGNAIAQVFSDHRLTLTDIDTMDVRSISQVGGFMKRRYDLVLHLAAMTDLEECDQDRERCYDTNAFGTMNVMEQAQKYGSKVVYISTAGVFDGQANSYREFDMPNPLNTYGRSKLMGEFSSVFCKNAWIVRAGWMMGGGPGLDKKFINKVWKQIKAGNRTLHALTDYYGSPTYTFDFANTIKEMVENEAPYGIYHAGGEGRTSRYEVAKEMLRILGLTNKVKLVPVTGDYFHKEFPVKRSKGEVLNNFSIKIEGFSKMRDWRVSLKEYLTRDFLPLCKSL
jgi:dTDP-4-dehydrorhamnose reductase